MNLVLYHDHCQDGFFSAYLAWKNLGDMDTAYISVSHRPVLDFEPIEALKYILSQTTFDIDQCREVNLYIFDFCFPPLYLEIYSSIFNSILVLDHHETVFKELSVKYPYDVNNNNNWFIFSLNANSKVIFSNKESSAKLVYKHFNEDKEVPWYIELVSDRDLNKNQYENTDKFYHGITLYKPYEFSAIDDLVDTDFKDIIELGGLIERNRLGVVAEIVKNIINIKTIIDGKEYKGAFVNTDLANASDVGNYILFCLKNYDYCVMYNIKDNKYVHCSIRSISSFDSLTIAHNFNGGGHTRSGGFAMKLEELYITLNNNLLTI